MQKMDLQANCSAANVQHVTKKSSDELLRKFADDDDDGVEARKEYLSRVSKRRKRSRKSRREEGDGWESPSSHHSSSSAALVERRSLLAPVTRKSALLRQLGIAGSGRPSLRSRDFKNRSVLAAIEQTWRKTLEGASRVLLETHYNRHGRLINDMI